MLQIITSSLAGIISFMFLDYIFLAHIAKKFYLEKLTSHITIKDGSLVTYLPAIPLVYTVAVIAIWVFILTKVTDVRHALLYGCTLGFCMYAFYDFTNLATFKDYSWSIAIVDILWGTFLVGIVTAIMFLVKNAIA
jgi:uncharacterized membrane protein